MGEIKLNMDALSDASQQIQCALPYLQELNQNSENFVSILEIGRLYNGIIGTFAFSEENEVFSKLKEISELINNVSDIYQKEGFSSIATKHIDFMNTAVKLSVEIINSIAEKNEIDDTIRSKYSLCISEYSKLDDVDEKETLSQDAIDDLLDNL